ncbi:Ribonuclease 3 [Manis pentadactyla]|nr:Ribonuclease 3 [Manis pentadactyla]
MNELMKGKGTREKEKRTLSKKGERRMNKRGNKCSAQAKEKKIRKYSKNALHTGSFSLDHSSKAHSVAASSRGSSPVSDKLSGGSVGSDQRLVNEAVQLTGEGNHPGCQTQMRMASSGQAVTTRPGWLALYNQDLNGSSAPRGARPHLIFVRRLLILNASESSFTKCKLCAFPSLSSPEARIALSFDLRCSGPGWCLFLCLPYQYLLFPPRESSPCSRYRQEIINPSFENLFLERLRDLNKFLLEASGGAAPASQILTACTRVPLGTDQRVAARASVKPAEG